jgi:hypothetical protein
VERRRRQRAVDWRVQARAHRVRRCPVIL